MASTTEPNTNTTSKEAHRAELRQRLANLNKEWKEKYGILGGPMTDTDVAEKNEYIRRIAAIKAELADLSIDPEATKDAYRADVRPLRSQRDLKGGESYAPGTKWEDAWQDALNKGYEYFVFEGKEYDVRTVSQNLRHKQGKEGSTDLHKGPHRSAQTYHAGYRKGGYNEPQLSSTEIAEELGIRQEGQNWLIPGYGKVGWNLEGKNSEETAKIRKKLVDMWHKERGKVYRGRTTAKNPEWDRDNRYDPQWMTDEGYEGYPHEKKKKK